MPNDTFPRVVVGIQDDLVVRANRAQFVPRQAHADPMVQPRATDCRGEARDVGASQHVAPEMVANRLAIAFVGMQIDNIHLELATHMHRATQLETRMTGIEETLHELIRLVKSLQPGWNTPTSVDGPT